MNLQNGKKICETLGIATEELAQMCHKGVIKAYNCDSGQEILASTACFTAFECPESTIFSFNSNGQKIIGISKRSVLEGNISFKKELHTQNEYHTEEYEGEQYIFYLRKEHINNHESRNFMADQIAAGESTFTESGLKDLFLEGSIPSKSKIKNVIKKDRCLKKVHSDSKTIPQLIPIENKPLPQVFPRTLLMFFKSEGMFKLQYIECDLSIQNGKLHFCKFNKYSTDVKVENIKSDVSSKFIIDKYDPNMISICSDKVYTLHQKKSNYMNISKNLENSSRKFEHFMKINLIQYSQFFVQHLNSKKKLYLMKDFYIFDKELLYKYNLHKNINYNFCDKKKQFVVSKLLINTEDFYNYIRGLCFDIEKINLLIDKKNYSHEINKDVKDFIISKYLGEINKLKCENKEITKKSIALGNKVAENKKTIDFINIYIEAVQGKTYCELFDKLSNLFGKTITQNSQVTKLFKVNFMSIANKLNIPFFMPVDLRSPKKLDEIRKEVLKYYNC